MARAGPLRVQTPRPAASQLPRLATGRRRAAVTKGHLSRNISRTFCRYHRVAFFVTAEEKALHLNLCILFARAMSEITKDIHVQSRARRSLKAAIRYPASTQLGPASKFEDGVKVQSPTAMSRSLTRFIEMSRVGRTLPSTRDFELDSELDGN